MKILISMVTGWLLAFSFGFIFGIESGNMIGLVVCLVLAFLNTLKLFNFI